jgi:dTMP kinase
MAHQYTGTLITVEGIDGAGKSSVVSQLGSRLGAAGNKIVTTKEPGGSKLGLVLRQMVQYQEIPLAPRAEYLLFAADRAQHFHEVVIPALQNGTLVISDRMSDSSLAYQGFGRGHDLTMIKIINQWTMHGIEPDLTIYLKIPVSIAYARMQERGAQKTVFESQKQEFLERVARGFDQIFATRSNVIIIDATQEQEKVVQETYERVQQWLAQRQK